MANANAVAPTTIEGWRAETETWQYELVPLLELPSIDLSVSVKSRLRRSRLLHLVLLFLDRYPITFLMGFFVLLGASVAVLLMSASLGRVLSIVGAMAGLPAILLSFSKFRYELVVLVVKTYNIWYVGVTSTVVFAIVGLLVHDVRSLVFAIAWAAFFISIFVDANLYALRYVWVASVGAALSCMVLAGSLSMGVVDDVHAFSIFHSNGYVLPAVAVARDGSVSMIVLMLRNLVRRYRNAITRKQTAAGSSGTTIQCVSFRCRLQLRPLGDPATTNARHQTRGPSQTLAARQRREAIRTQLQFAPFLDAFDARDSVIPMPSFWTIDPHQQTMFARCGCSLFRIVGGVCFLLPNAVIFISLLPPPSLDRHVLYPATVTCTAVSTLLVLACLSTAQRQLLWAVVASFDFLFIAVQGTVIELALVDLCGWRPEIAVALLSDWIWSSWMMCWDAVPLPARKRLGVTSRFAAFVGTGLIAIINVTACILLVVLPRDAIHDRVFVGFDALGQRVELRALTWYLSCTSTIVTWAIRTMWRLWRSTDTELVVLDGPVFFEKSSPSRGPSNLDRADAAQPAVGGLPRCR